MGPIKIFIMGLLKGFYYGYIKNVKKKCYLYFS